MEELVKRYEKLVSSCRPEVAEFIRFVYDGDTWKQFRDWPAAVSHHHAYANGLLEHTLSVTDCAKSMAESLRTSGYDIDVDIVVAGGLLHDLGKLGSYRMGSIPEMTLEGAVLDHIAIGYSKFMELAGKKRTRQFTKTSDRSHPSEPPRTAGVRLTSRPGDP